MFQRDRCDLCGDCLVRCPELELPREEAQEEIRRLVLGEASRHVLTGCSSCLSCNTYCTKGCQPYDLILARWHERYRRLGTPPIWKFVFPNRPDHLWRSLHALLPPRARRTVEGWMTARPTEEIFLPGSFFQLVPEVLEGSRLLDGLTVLALPGHWECGAYLHQGGHLDAVRRIGEMVRDDLDRWGVRRAVVGLDAVHLMFTRIQPEAYGIRFSQTFTDFHGSILRRIEEGGIRIERTLDRTVTVHDNCYAKAAGDRCFDQARGILEAVGARVVEMRHHRADALCCGFGRGAGWRTNLRIPLDILQGTARRLREAEETGAETLVTYCAGCFWLLLAARELVQSPVRVVHLVELLREAMDEPADFPREDRAWDILAVMTWHILRNAAGRSFWIENVRAVLDPERWEKAPRPSLRALRRTLASPAGQAAFRAGFRGAERLIT